MDSALWSAFLGATPDPVFVCTPDLRCARANAAALALVGARDTAAVTDRPLDDVLGARAAAAVTPYLARAAATGETVTARHTLALDAGEHHVDATCIPVTGEDGTVTALLAHLHDVTDVVAARDAARDSLNRREREFHAVFDNAGMGIALADADGTVRRLNAAFGDLFGCTTTACRGRPLADIIAAAQGDDSHALMAALQAGHRRRAGIQRPCRRADGAPGWAQVTLAAVHDPDGRLREMVAVAMDVSDRVSGEAALERERQRLDLILDSVADGVLEVNGEGTVTYANRAAAGLTGHQRDELRGRRAHPLLHEPPDGESAHALAACPVHRTLADGQTRRVTDDRFRRADDTWLPVEYSVASVPDGDSAGAVVVFHDATERQRMASAQADRERMYRQMFTNNPAIKLLIEPDSGRIVDANPAAARFYGMTVDALCHEYIHDINTLSPEATRAEMEQARREQRLHFNFRHRLADGSERNVEVYSGPVNVGGHTYLHSIVHDVTEEKAYRAQLEGYRDLFERLPVGVYRAGLDRDGGVLEANQAFATILDAGTAEDVAGLRLAELYTDTRDRAAFVNTLRDEGEVRRNTLPVRTLAGRDIEISVVARRLPGDADTYGGIIQDVTERRRAERERNRLAAVLEATPDMVSMATPEGRVLYDNPALKRVLGVAADATPPSRDLRERHPAWANRLIETEGLPTADRDGTWQGETAFLAGDGTEIPTSQIIIAHRDAGGRVERYATIMRDLRPERRMEEARRQLIEILESTPDFISMADPERNVIYLSAGARRMVGLPPSKPGAMGFDVPPEIARAGEWLHPDWASETVVNEGVPAALEHGTWEGESAIRDVNGREIPVSQVIIAHFDERGSVARLSTILRDISARKEMEAELQRSNAELESFAYSVSHDLQEPLRLVTSFLDLLDRRFGESLPQRAHEYVSRARDGTGRMQAMINGLLEYSRVTTRGGAFATVPARQALDEALANLDLTIRETGAELQVGDLPDVQADPNQLARLFQNLIGNALKYRHPDRAPVIRVDADVRPDGMARFAVADNGRGMAPEDRERAFMLFQRLEADPDAPAGSGIGLAICKRIVERHGGRIDVDGTPGAGTIFRFTLPRGGA